MNAAVRGTLGRRQPPTGQPHEEVENRERMKPSGKNRKWKPRWLKSGTSRDVQREVDGQPMLGVSTEGNASSDPRTDAQGVDTLEEPNEGTANGVMLGSPSTFQPMHPYVDERPLSSPTIPLTPAPNEPPSVSHPGHGTSSSLQGAVNTRVRTLEVMHVAGSVDKHTSYHFSGPVLVIGSLPRGSGTVRDLDDVDVMLLALCTSGFFFSEFRKQ